MRSVFFGTSAFAVAILDRTERGQRKAAMRALREGTTYSPSPEPEPDPEDD